MVFTTGRPRHFMPWSFSISPTPETALLPFQCLSETHHLTYSSGLSLNQVSERNTTSLGVERLLTVLGTPSWLSLVLHRNSNFNAGLLVTLKFLRRESPSSGWTRQSRIQQVMVPPPARISQARLYCPLLCRSLTISYCLPQLSYWFDLLELCMNFFGNRQLTGLGSILVYAFIIKVVLGPLVHHVSVLLVCMYSTSNCDEYPRRYIEEENPLISE